jgi:hypothetical protein
MAKDEWQIWRDQGRKIQAIKALREQYPYLGLREAKNIVDGVEPPPAEPAEPAPTRVNAILGPTLSDSAPALKNQFGQSIHVGDWVGYVSKTGSHTTRKVGIVYELSSKRAGYPSKDMPAVRIEWQLDGSYGEPKKCDDRPSLVDVNNVFRIPAASNWRD